MPQTRGLREARATNLTVTFLLNLLFISVDCPVVVESVVLGVLPVSVLPIVVTLLGAVACSAFWGPLLGEAPRGLPVGREKGE